MVITVVCDILGEENNGTTIAAMNLIRFLQQKHTVRILCADQSKKGIENYFVVPNQSFGKQINSIVKQVGVTLAKPDNMVIIRALKDAEHVHIMMPLSLGLRAAEFARAMNLPITAGFHMQAENMTSHVRLQNLPHLSTSIYKYIYKHLYRYADGIHYPTDFIRNTFESRIKKTTNGYVISNGVHSYVQKRDTKKPEKLKDKIVILSIGRYSAEKSQDTLIKAVYRSQFKNNIQLILAGQGLNEKKYRRLAKGLPLQPVFGTHAREEIVDMLNYCDLYVHPAIAELEGIACLEAIACGKMMIVSNSAKSATKHFAIDNKCIFKRKNAKDLARVMDYWITHPQDRAEYENAYLNSAAIYNQEDCMRKMENMILEVNRKRRYS